MISAGRPFFIRPFTKGRIKKGRPVKRPVKNAQSFINQPAI
jgi:hypothetical protein